MKRRVAFVGLVLVFVLVLAVEGCGPGTAPGGQPAMQTVSATLVESIRTEFNQAKDRTRVILLLSPT